MKSRKIGMIIAGCIGDVLGSQSEGMTRDRIITQFKPDVTELPHGKKYTDDSEMMIILLRHLVKNRKVVVNELHKEYANIDFRRGYSQNTRDLLLSIRNGKFPTEMGRSPCDGAVMRISPIALLDIDENTLGTEVQMAIYYTHGGCADAHATAYIHCVLLRSLLAADDLIDNRKELFLNILSKAETHQPLWCKLNIVYRCIYSTEPVESITKELTGNKDTFQIYAIDAFCCSVYSFFRFYEDPKRAIIYAASMGGDTDTIAKMTGDMCGARYGLDWIPDNWKGVEDQEELWKLTEQL